MTDHPILFSAPMVRALLDGSKTQTRRIIKDRGALPEFCGGRYDDQNDPSCWGFQDYERGKWITLDQWQRWRFVPYRPGDRLWARENWRPHGAGNGILSEQDTSWCTGPDDVEHMADAPEESFAQFRFYPSIHMPRWASRLTLVVTDVRVQRLQEISEADAAAEAPPQHPSYPDDFYCSCKEAFEFLWKTTYDRDAWDQNPWVVATTFTTHHCNIDKMGEA
ncbi:hypothetical protein MHM39_15040 [Phaeobacter sp. CNT1-3]|nr:hypothetical protein [Phaeobacter sp. CNT1-3]